MSDKCQCVRCGECNGSSYTAVSTGSYPEFEMEPCEQCDGTGISEVCDYCRECEERDDLDHHGPPPDATVRHSGGH